MACIHVCVSMNGVHGAPRGGSGFMSNLLALDDVPAHFHRDAPLDPHQRRRHHAVLGALSHVPRGRLLDYGCGWGDITWAMARTHPDIHAVDIDAARVEFARREFAPVDFGVCRPDGLDFEDASFDCVTSVVVLPFVPDDGAYLREVRRVLKPEGHFLLATKICPRLRQLSNLLTGHPERSRMASTGLRTHTARDVLALLEAHGFGVISRSGFFDPPFDARKNAGDLLNGAIELLAEAASLESFAPYQVFLCRLGEVRRA